MSDGDFLRPESIRSALALKPGMKIADFGSGSGDFAVMDRRVIHILSHCKEQEPFIRGLRAWVGFRQMGVPYERSARAAGEVKYTFRKLMKLALNGIFSFSTRPLRIATWFGFAISLLAFFGVIFTILQRLFAESFAKVGLAPVPGFATIVIAILMLGGIQLICLGILGEYVGRIFLEVKGRPLTIIAESNGFADVNQTVGHSAPAVVNETPKLTEVRA